MRRPGEWNRAGENVICPLFIAVRENEIRCQAHMPDAAATVIVFQDHKAYRTQRNCYCEGLWERCEHYLAWKHFMWEDDDE